MRPRFRIGIWVGLVCACSALSGCTRGTTESAGSTPTRSAGSTPTHSAGSTPTRAEVVDQVYGYLVTRSFHGANGGLVLDDGQSLAFDVDIGVQRRTVSPSELVALADAMADASFFELPERLHNNEVLDGNEAQLMGATSARVHWSVNYMDRSKDYARALAAVAKLAPKPIQPPAEAPQALYASVEAYLARSGSSPKAVAVRRWLDSARALFGTNASLGVRPVGSAPPAP